MTKRINHIRLHWKYIIGMLVVYWVYFCILDSERNEEAIGFTMVFIFYILYTKFLPEGVLRFQHIVPYLLANWIKMVL